MPTRARAARRRRAGALVAAVLLPAACTGGADEPEVEPALTTTTTPPVPREDDGVLRIGLMLPLSTSPVVADDIERAATAAVAAINGAGGVLGSDVELLSVDEGDTPATAVAAVLDLDEDQVDAIVGPAASSNAINAIQTAVDAGLTVCSATASSALLDDLPDDMRFFRTIPSDSMQAVAIAEVAENTGGRLVSVVHIDDAYGRPYAEAVVAALEDRPLDVVQTIALPTGGELDAQAAELVDGGADVAIVLGAAADSTRFLSAVGRTTTLGDIRRFVVNDAVRSPAAQPVIAELPALLRGLVTGVAPQVTTRTAGQSGQVAFEPQVTDCINLLALGAVQANSDSPSLIAAQLPPASSGGQPCFAFEACVTSLGNDSQIDYKGPATELNRTGETSRAWFERFTFDSDGSDRFDGAFQITR